MTNFYAGIRAGRMVLTEAFAQALARDGCPPGPHIQVEGRGFAMDAAINDDEDGPGPGSTEALNRAYEQMLRGGGQVPYIPTLPNDDFERRAQTTRRNAETVRQGFTRNTPAEESAAFDRYRKARGWDRCGDGTMHKNFALERAYAELLNEPQPLRPPTDAKGGN